MTTSPIGTTNNSDREIVMERVFDAPRPLVFKAFSTPDYLKRWWGPNGWSLPVCELDFRTGGTWFYCMRGPEGEESWGKSEYREIVTNERIVYADSFVDSDGNAVEGMPVGIITLDFLEEDGKTRIVSRSLYPTADIRQEILDMGMLEGFKETWDRLDEVLHLEQAG